MGLAQQVKIGEAWHRSEVQESVNEINQILWQECNHSIMNAINPVLCLF